MKVSTWLVNGHLGLIDNQSREISLLTFPLNSSVLRVLTYVRRNITSNGLTEIVFYV